MRRAALVTTLAVALASCGSSPPAPPKSTVSSRTLKIYMSGPWSGDSSKGALSAMNGARMALERAGGRIGRDRIVLVVLDDATPQSDGWDPNQTSINAKRAALDPDTVGYIGDFDSGASAISIPVLNRAGIAQLSPEGGAVGLTSAGPGASPGEPGKYYPMVTRTFARLVPNDLVEATAEVRVQQRLGCRAVFVLQDGEVDGEDAAISYALTAQAAGLRMLGVQTFQRHAAAYASLASSVAQAGSDCILLDASDERSSVAVVEALAAVLPSARVFASSALADSAFTDPAEGGLPVSLDDRVVMLSPALAPALYPRAGRGFLASYRLLYGDPQPQAIFGYEAMSLMLHAVAVATDGGHARAARSRIVAAIFATRRRASVLGTYSIDRNGDTTLHRYGVWRLHGGTPVFWMSQNG